MVVVSRGWLTVKKWIFLLIAIVLPLTDAWAGYTPGKSKEADTFQASLRLEAINILKIRKNYFEMILRCYKDNCAQPENTDFEDFKNNLPFMITSFRKGVALSNLESFTSTTQTGAFLKTGYYGTGPKQIQLPGSPPPPPMIFDDEQERDTIVKGFAYRDRFAMETKWQKEERLKYEPNDPFLSRFHDAFAETTADEAKQYYTLWFNEWLKRFTFLAYIPHLHPSNEEVSSALQVVVKKMTEFIRDLPDPDKVDIARVIYFDGALERVRAKHPELNTYITKQLTDAPKDTFVFYDWLKGQATIPAGAFAACGVMALIVKRWNPICSAASLVYTASSIWDTWNDFRERTDDFVVGVGDYSRIQKGVWKIIYTAVATTLVIKGTLTSIAAIEARPSAMSLALKETREKIRDRKEWQKAISEYIKSFTKGAVKSLPLQVALTAGKTTSAFVVGKELMRHGSTRDLVSKSKDTQGFFVSYADVLEAAKNFSDQLR